MTKSLRRQVAVFALCSALSFLVTACGNSDPYETGIHQFEGQVSEHTVQHPTANWTAYVAHGMVTTGWLWFKHQSPVVYVDLENTSTNVSSDIVVQFGRKTVAAPGLGPGFSMSFYITSSDIPQHVFISWKQNGQSHQESISLGSMINVD